MNANATVWTKDGNDFTLSNGKAAVRMRGERFVVEIDGAEVKGQAGGVRYFSTPQRAVAATNLILGDDLAPAELPKLKAPQFQKATPTPTPPDPTPTPEPVAPKAPEAGLGASEAPSGDTSSPTAAPRKFRKPKFPTVTKEQAASDAVTIVQGGSVERRPGKVGAFQAIRPNGEILCGPTGGRRLFRSFDSAAAALLSA